MNIGVDECSYVVFYPSIQVSTLSPRAFVYYEVLPFFPFSLFELRKCQSEIFILKIKVFGKKKYAKLHISN